MALHVGPIHAAEVFSQSWPALPQLVAADCEVHVRLDPLVSLVLTQRLTGGVSDGGVTPVVPYRRRIPPSVDFNLVQVGVAFLLAEAMRLLVAGLVPEVVEAVEDGVVVVVWLFMSTEGALALVVRSASAGLRPRGGLGLRA